MRQAPLAIMEWTEAEPVIRAVREAVFLREQGVPEESEWDGQAPACLHVLARDDRGAAIGTARLYSKGQIGRVAVSKE